MPWCDTCDKHLLPNTLTVDGRCPTCDEEADTQDMKVQPTSKAPWHFWVMVAALVLYLGWRLVQAAVWLIGSL